MTSSISHPNVVTTYDYLVKNVVKPGGSTRRILQETQIIMEFCDRGSLGHVVEEGFFHCAAPPGLHPGMSPPYILQRWIAVTLARPHILRWPDVTVTVVVSNGRDFYML
jgi:hypothetical protein